MAYSQAYEHMMDITSGHVLGHDLMLKLVPDTSVTFNAGAVVSLKSNGKIQTGAAAATSLMMLAVNGTADLDVDGGDDYNVVKGTNTKIGCVVLSGRVEVKTTEFITASTYNPGSLVMPATGDNLSKLTPQTGELGDTGACGVVTRGKFTDRDGQSMLQFVGVYFPGHTHAATT